MDLFVFSCPYMLDRMRLGKAAAVKGERCRSNRSGNAKNKIKIRESKMCKFEVLSPHPLSWMFSHRLLLLNQDWCKEPFPLMANSSLLLHPQRCMQHRWIQCRKIMYESIFSYHTYTEKQRTANNLRLYLHWSSNHLGGWFDFWSKKPP